MEEMFFMAFRSNRSLKDFSTVLVFPFFSRAHTTLMHFDAWDDIRSVFSLLKSTQNGQMNENSLARNAKITHNKYGLFDISHCLISPPSLNATSATWAIPTPPTQQQPPQIAYYDFPSRPRDVE